MQPAPECPQVSSLATPAPADAATVEPNAAAHSEEPREAVATTAEAPKQSDAEDIDDGLELEPPADGGQVDIRAAVLELSDEELERKVKDDLASLGAMSMGRASGGSLINGVHMPEGEHWELVSPGLAWATEETIDFLKVAIAKVHDELPGGHVLRIGHISAKRGGALSPHKSHQSGRDVDISYFYRDSVEYQWFRRATKDNLDIPRTWAFVRALITETDVEMIFINTYLQVILKEHALASGEDAEWIDSVFQAGSKHHRPIVRHAKGHDTHIHIRFFNPVAQELGRRAYPYLADGGHIKPLISYTKHKARKGDILGNLAKRYGTSVEEIQRANGLRNTRIRAGKTYLIPKKTGTVKRPPAVVIPPRRLPPKKEVAATSG